MRGALILFMVLCAIGATAFELYGCNNTAVPINTSHDYVVHVEHVQCLVDRQPLPTHAFGWFLPNQDVVASVGADDVILRIEQRNVVRVNPVYNRPSVRVECPEDLVASYIEQVRWPDRYDDVRKIVSQCSVRALRFVVVPQVAGLQISVAQAQGVLDLLGEYDVSVPDLVRFTGDVVRLLFAAPHALMVFVAQFAGVGV